jgi:hypothetical protein
MVCLTLLPSDKCIERDPIPQTDGFMADIFVVYLAEKLNGIT